MNMSIYCHNRQLKLEYLTLWIWFTSTVAICRPAVSIDVSPRICLVLFLLLGVCFLSIILSQWKCSKQSNVLWRQIPDISILLMAHIGWSKQSNAVTCWEFRLFVHSIQSFIRWCCMSGVCTTSFNDGKMELFKRVAEMFGRFTRFDVFLNVVKTVTPIPVGFNRMTRLRFL